MADEKPWDGVTERRQEDRKTVYEQLGELRVRMTHIEEAVETFGKMRDDLHAIKELMQQAKGFFTAVKGIVIYTGPVIVGAIATITWIVSHVDWAAK